MSSRLKGNLNQIECTVFAQFTLFVLLKESLPLPVEFSKLTLHTVHTTLSLTLLRVINKKQKMLLYCKQIIFL